MSIETITIQQMRIRIQATALKHHEWQSCLNCIEWTKSSRDRIRDETEQSGYRLVEGGPKCMKYHVMPPPEVLVVGCENHDWDIPF